jgi:hypothetical protein
MNGTWSQDRIKQDRKFYKNFDNIESFIFDKIESFTKILTTSKVLQKFDNIESFIFDKIESFTKCWTSLKSQEWFIF